VHCGNRPDGTLWRNADGAVGGLGAEHDRPGYGSVKSLMLGNMKSVPIEMLEARYPLKYRVNRLDWEAGGAGAHRGGPGDEISATTRTVTSRFPAEARRLTGPMSTRTA
jgi:N-methylhydantoinase B/oxoprolinase/acetone carboxylase alpha subunit